MAFLRSPLQIPVLFSFRSKRVFLLLSSTFLTLPPTSQFLIHVTHKSTRTYPFSFPQSLFCHFFPPINPNRTRRSIQDHTIIHSRTCPYPRATGNIEYNGSWVRHKYGGDRRRVGRTVVLLLVGAHDGGRSVFGTPRLSPHRTSSTTGRLKSVRSLQDTLVHTFWIKCNCISLWE